MSAEFTLIEREIQLKRQQSVREAEQWQLARLARGERRHREPRLGVLLGTVASRFRSWLGSRPALPPVAAPKPQQG
jgi:hypothetical protein